MGIQAVHCRLMDCLKQWWPFQSSEEADFSSFNLVTLGRACPRLVARRSNGRNTLEDLITTQAALRCTLGMLKTLAFLIAANSSQKEASLLYPMKGVQRRPQ